MLTRRGEAFAAKTQMEHSTKLHPGTYRETAGVDSTCDWCHEPILAGGQMAIVVHNGLEQDADGDVTAEAQHPRSVVCGWCADKWSSK
jgi:hypothetical protein